MYIINNLDFLDTSNLRYESVVRDFQTEFGTKFRIEIFYNKIDGYMYMNLFDSDNELIMSGERVLQEVDLVRSCSFLFQNDFNLYVINKNDFYEKDITPENFNIGMVMVYVESEKDI